MPIELKPKSSVREAAPEETQGLMLFNEDGELTLAGETIADFLSTADFSAITESEAALPFLSNPAACADDPYAIDEAKKKKSKKKSKKDDMDMAYEDSEEEEEGFDEAKKKKKKKAGKDSDGDYDESPPGEMGEGDAADDEEIAEVALPGVVAARLVDATDLTEMFGYYLDQLSWVDEPSLQEQATLAVFADYRDEDGGIAEDRREEVAALLTSVLSEGVVYDAAEEISERILTKGQRRKATRIRNKPKSGKRRAELRLRRRVEGRGAKKQKIARQHKMRNRRKVARIAQLARESEEGTLVFGLGEGINGANFKIGLVEDPNLEFTSEQLIEFDALGGNIFECPDCYHTAPYFAFIDEMKKKSKKKKSKKDDMDMADEAKKKKKKKAGKDSDGDYDESPSGEMGEGVEEMTAGGPPKVGMIVKYDGPRTVKRHEGDDGIITKISGKRISVKWDRGTTVHTVDDLYLTGEYDESIGEGACPECGCVIESMLDEKGKVPPAFLKHMKGKKKDDDEGMKKDMKKKKDESVAPSHVPGAFAVAAGRPNLSEGHSLAAATLGVLGGRKSVLTEDED